MYTFLQSHLERKKVFHSSSVLEKWYKTCFSRAITPHLLMRIWDKLVGGSQLILIYLLMEIMKTFQESLSLCESEANIKNLVEQVTVLLTNIHFNIKYLLLCRTKVMILLL